MILEVVYLQLHVIIIYSVSVNNIYIFMNKVTKILILTTYNIQLTELREAVKYKILYQKPI